MIKKVNSKSVYEDKWLKFFQDEIKFPDGSSGTYAWADRKSGVGIVVITKDKKVLLHREYRYPIKDYSWEIQGGGIDDGETVEQAAVRELEEETGIQMNESELALENLNDDFIQQLSSDNLPMMEAYDELQRVVVPLKTDLLINLSITVDYVDADGD